MAEDRKTILVVDDEPTMLSFVENMLVYHGYQPLLAKTGEEALEICEERKSNIDLLITDIVLPSMKGYELAKIFKKKYPDSKTLYMSGYLSPAIPEEEQLNREKAFIQKPFTSKKFMKLFLELLNL